MVENLHWHEEKARSGLVDEMKQRQRCCVYCVFANTYEGTMCNSF